MTAPLHAFTSDGRVVISFPEAAVPAEVREDFIATVKREWEVRQSKLTEAAAQSLAEELDSGWWQRNRARILHSIGEE